MTFQEKINSAVDDTIKYVFTGQKSRIEFSFIKKADNRYSICIPTMTMCGERCSFCHTSSHIGRLRLEQIAYRNIVQGITHIIDDLGLETGEELLLSFMGMGEPLRNPDILDVIECFATRNAGTRFAISTSLPKDCVEEFFNLTRGIANLGLKVKMHLSLHSVYEEERKELMPYALDIKSSMAMMQFYQAYTRNPVELQYIVQPGMADCDGVVDNLIDMQAFNNRMLVKFMPLNLKGVPTSWDTPDHAIYMMKRLSETRIKSEYCVSPGLDIGSSCGSFNMDEYLKK